MKGQEIVIACDPTRQGEGIITDTSLPGTLMEIVPGVIPVNGRHSWRHYQPTSDGDPRLIAVLDIDHEQGKRYNDAYVANTRCFLYFPLPGEELNMLVLGEPGTSSTNVVTIGERLIGAHASGKLVIQSNSANAAPFVAMEKVTEVPVDTDAWVWCMRA